MQRLKCSVCKKYFLVSDMQYDLWKNAGEPELICDDCLKIKEEENEEK